MGHTKIIYYHLHSVTMTPAIQETRPVEAVGGFISPIVFAGGGVDGQSLYRKTRHVPSESTHFN